MDESDPLSSEGDWSESSGSFSLRQLTAAEEEYDDSLPGMEGLQISGVAYPGRFIQACGFFTNGASRCQFAWVRYSENGSVSYIEGESKATYLVNADDIGSCLAVEVTPINDMERHGEVVRVMANEHRKICCDAEMQAQIERFFFNGFASFDATVIVWLSSSFSLVHTFLVEIGTIIGMLLTKLTISAFYLQEHVGGQKVRVEIERRGFRIIGSLYVAVQEKFSPRTSIMIPAGSATGFLVHCTNGSEYLLSTDDNSFLRDVIVLTMRLFIVRELKKQERRKSCLFL